MFTWANFLSGLVSLFNKIAALVHDKRQQELGAKEAKLEGMNEYDEKVNTARDAVANVDSLPIKDDSANRANRK